MRGQRPEILSRRPGWILLGAFLLLMIAVSVTLPLLDPVDIHVYRMGGESWLEGGNQLYAAALAPSVDGGVTLPFLYPPLAAVLFVPLALIPWQAAAILVTVAGLVALTASCYIASRSLHGPGDRAVRIALLAAIVAVLLDPVRMTVFSGQINLILMGLVVADCLLPRTRWPRGVLIGLAAAIKLTPLVFLLFFLPQRQWRPAATAVGTFVGLGVIGFALAPAESITYWSSTFVDTSRLADAAVPINQSISGVLALFGLEGTAHSVLWIILCAVLVALAWPAVRLARNGGHDLAALLLVAVAGLLVSPISWNNHWVWIAPALPLLAYLGRIRRGMPVKTSALAVVLVFFAGLPMVVTVLHPSGVPWAPWELVLGNGYVLIGMAVLLVGLLAWRAPRAELDPPVRSGPADQGT